MQITKGGPEARSLHNPSNSVTSTLSDRIFNSILLMRKLRLRKEGYLSQSHTAITCWPLLPLVSFMTHHILHIMMLFLPGHDGPQSRYLTNRLCIYLLVKPLKHVIYFHFFFLVFPSFRYQNAQVLHLASSHSNLNFCRSVHFQGQISPTK